MLCSPGSLHHVASFCPRANARLRQPLHLNIPNSIPSFSLLETLKLLTPQAGEGGHGEPSGYPLPVDRQAHDSLRSSF